MPENGDRELTFAQAIREALAEEMRRDPRVFILGEDIAEAGHPFKVLTGLVEEFGAQRVLDTPISEAGFTGIAVGAAMTGMRPVIDIMFGDFIGLTMDQMVNQAAKIHYMSGGKWKAPLVMRTTLGATRRSAAQHSQSLHAWFCHIPGLKVVMPSTPFDAKGLLKSAIRDDNPVVVFEDKMMYRLKGPVPEEEYTIPLGVADIKREGSDITIIATSSMVQVALGAAMTGMRPVIDIMFGDFIGLTMDQMVNQAAKIHYMSGGKWKAPLVMRTTLGATRRSAAQHSQSLHAWFCHIPGLKVVMPSTPYDAKGLLKSAIRDDNPVVFFEDKMMYRLKGAVPEEEYTIPLGVADIKRAGSDITIIATSSMVQVALGAASLLEESGISAEVVDPRTLWPLDEKTLVESARKTSRVIVVDEGYGRYGVTAEIASVIQENAFFDLEAPVKRMGAMHVPIPFSPPLEDVTVPTEKTVAEAARVLCGAK